MQQMGVVPGQGMLIPRPATTPILLILDRACPGLLQAEDPGFLKQP